MDKKSCVTCIDPEKCWSIHHQKECANNNYKNWQPKQEDKMKKACDTCDYSENMVWNSYGCDKNRNEATGTCDNDRSKWKLRRDYNQENKEQEMSYKPTSKMTIRNIAKKIKETGCKDASMKFVEYLCIVGEPNEGTIRVDKKLDKHSRLFTHLTKTNESTEWAIQHKFIKAEIKCKSYTIDYQSYNLNIKTKVEFNGYIDDENEDTLFFKLDNGKEFDIDKDLITKIDPVTPF